MMKIMVQCSIPVFIFQIKNLILYFNFLMIFASIQKVSCLPYKAFLFINVSSPKL